MKKKKTPAPLGYTKLLKQQKAEKEFWKALGIEDPEQAPHHVNHMDFRESLITDEELALMTTRIKSIEMLDLNGTEITNEGIRHLVQMEYLAELRLKECEKIDNDCISFLNEMPTLKFLYLKSTPVTIEGLLELKLPNLEHLFFSSHQKEIQEAHMQILRMHLPKAEFIIDGKPF
ncbi:MAG: hypothetical protein ACXWV0_09460 [Flavisolibacter sp.]